MFKDTHDGHTNFYCGCMSTRTYEHGICTTCGGVEREPLPAEVTDQLSNRTRKEMGLPPKPRKPSAPKQRRGEFATLTRRFGWHQKETETFEVEVLARAKGYAMVRRKGCMVFVASERDLTPNDQVQP